MSNEAATVGQDDLTPEQTEGFKVGEKKTIDEYQKLGKSLEDLFSFLLKSYALSSTYSALPRGCHAGSKSKQASMGQYSQDDP